MEYSCNTPDDQRAMLEVVGVESAEELLEQVPDSLQLERDLDLPRGLTEMELTAHLRSLAECNGPAQVCFLGGGVYDHFIPATVDELTGRGEFYTAYTPYQAEASQGSLQAFFEFQTLITQLTGMDVANASLYEGATALSEAAFMAMRVTGRHGRVVIPGSLHPEYEDVLRTYLTYVDGDLVHVPTPDGTCDLSRIQEELDENTACLVIQQPNFFGCLEPVEQLVELAHSCGALAIVCFDPISLGILKRPGDYGADIAVAEGQSLGTPLQYGGPFLGLLACRQQYVRKMPGRLIGETVDRQGRRSFVLNLQAREQHIRREKATSNICTNQGLLALRAAVYLTSLGPHGIREVAELSCQKAHYAAEQLVSHGCRLLFDRPFFKEFAIGPGNIDEIQRSAHAAGIDVGPRLDAFPRLNAAGASGLLVAVTEQRTRDEIDRLAKAVQLGING